MSGARWCGLMLVAGLLWPGLAAADSLSREDWQALVRVDPGHALAQVRSATATTDDERLFFLRIECESLRDLGRYHSVVALQERVAQYRLMASPDEVALLLCIGFSREELGDLDDAASHYEMARTMAQTLGDDESQVRSLYGRARVKWQHGDSMAAVIALQEAQSLLKPDMDPRVHAAVLYLYGELFRSFAAYLDAIRLYEQAEGYARRNQDDAALLPILRGLGLSYLGNHDVATASAYFRQLQQLADNSQLSLFRVLALDGLVRVAVAEGTPSMMLETQLEAGRMQLADPELVVQVNTSLARSALIRGDWNTVLARVDDSLPLLTTHRQLDEQYHDPLLMLAAAAHAGAGDDAKALDLARQAYDVLLASRTRERLSLLQDMRHYLPTARPAAAADNQAATERPQIQLAVLKISLGIAAFVAVILTVGAYILGVRRGRRLGRRTP